MFGCFNIAVLILSSVVSGGCINAGSKWPAVDGVTTIKWCHVSKNGKANSWEDDDLPRIQAAMTWWEENGANVQFSDEGECTDECEDCVKVHREACTGPTGSYCSVGTSSGAGKHKCSICMFDSQGRLRHEIAHILGFCHEQDCFGLSTGELFKCDMKKLCKDEMVAKYCNADGRKDEHPPAKQCAIHDAFDVTSVMLYADAVLCPDLEDARTQNGGVALNHNNEDDTYPSDGDTAAAIALYPPAARSSSEEGVASMISSRFHASERASAPILLSVSGILLLLFTLICFRVCKIKQTGSQYAELLYDDEI